MTTGKAFMALPIALLIGCSAERGGEGMSGEGEMGMEMAAVEYAVEITNPMPHDMMVYAEIGTRVIALGMVAAKESASFTLTETEATDVSLRATDAGRTHSPMFTVTLMKDQPATWTIGQ